MDIAGMSKVQLRRGEWGEVGNELDNISPVYQLTLFYYYLIGSIQVSFTHRNDINELDQRRTTSQFKSSESYPNVSAK